MECRWSTNKTRVRYWAGVVVAVGIGSTQHGAEVGVTGLRNLSINWTISITGPKEAAQQLAAATAATSGSLSIRHMRLPTSASL
jgi:hypothetical protein